MARDRSPLTLAPRNMNDNLIANNSCWNDGGSAQKRLARQLVGRFSLRHSFLSGLSYSPHHRICRCDNTFKTFSLRNRIRPLTYPNIQPYCRCVKQTTYLFTTPVSRGYQQSRILSSTSFKDAWLAEEGRAFPPPTPLVGLSRRRAAGSLTFTGDVFRDATAAPHCSLDTRHIPRRVAEMSQSWRKRIFRATSGKSLPRATGAVQGKCWFA